jgi:hypothetical protein
MDEQLTEHPRFLPPGFGTVGHQDFVELSVPEEVSLAPQTPAWYLLGAALAGAAVVAMVRAAQRYRRDAYRRAALTELARLREAAAGAERSDALAQLPVLLKRCALAAFSRERVAGLSGARWHAFLEHTAPGALGDAAKSTLSMLVLEGAGELPPQVERDLFDGIERWLRRHRA